MSGRDYQQSKVYAWENQVVAPRCKRLVEYKDAQAFVDGIFLCEGMLYPPKVVPLPKQARRIWADGNRGQIRLPEVVPAWVIIHEMSHTLTTDHDNCGDQHGPNFVGIYIKMLDKYMDVPLALTMYTLGRDKIAYNIAATVKFIEQEV